MDTCARNPKSIQEARQRDRVFRVEEKHVSICFQAASAAEFALGRKKELLVGRWLYAHGYVCSMLSYAHAFSEVCLCFSPV